jgi:5-methylcytosine-specific restriction enzyme subunit McrC
LPSTLLPARRTSRVIASTVWFFDSEMERARVYGLARDYVDVQETLTTIRGRVDIAEQLRRRQLRPFPLECRFQSFTEDTPLNRVLKRAHEVAVTVPRIGSAAASRIAHRQRRLFADVNSDQVDRTHLPSVTFTHVTSHWRPAYWLASLLLASGTLRDDAGAVIGQSFTVRMDRVFERFVETIVTEQLSAHGLDVVAQMPLALTTTARVVETSTVLPGVDMRPDLVVTAAGAPVAVADVKYKKTDDIGDFQNPDVYQVLAYCAALGVPQGLLIYADSQPHTTQVVQLPAYDTRITLHVVGIDVSQPWRIVLEQARNAAHVLEMIARDASREASVSVAA